MATLTREVLKTWNQPTWTIIRNAISLQALVAGATPYDSQVGQTIDLFGQEAVPASRFSVAGAGRGHDDVRHL